MRQRLIPLTPAVELAGTGIVDTYGIAIVKMPGESVAEPMSTHQLNARPCVATPKTRFISSQLHFSWQHNRALES